MLLDDILTQAVERQASDIFLIAGLPVSYKCSGVIRRQDAPPLKPTDTAELAALLYERAGRTQDALLSTGDDDFSFAVPHLSRFRVNALRQRGSLGLIIRVVPFTLPDYRNCHIPESVMAFSRFTRGLALITGAAGSGKSTTLACIIDAINTTRNCHIITLEDPIEFLHSHKQSVVTQRELSIDTANYDVAFRAALREAPDIILLGEMRDPDAIRAAVTAAESGHLVISTLHTVGAANTIDRIVDVFPPEQQHQIRTQLALVLEGVASQQLVTAQDGTLIPAFEVMTATPAIRNMIRESKAHQLDAVIASSAGDGMSTMDQSLLSLARQGLVSQTVAHSHAINPDWLEKRLAAL